MLEIIFFLFGILIIFYIIAWPYLSVKTATNKSDEELIQKVMDQFPKLYIEKSGTQYYLFEKDTEVFKCQSTTIDDLAKKYYEYTESVMAFVRHNNEKLVFIEGEVIEEDSLTSEIEVK
jgi:uncharacterized alpha/beta hydrolase family protein